MHKEDFTMIFMVVGVFNKYYQLTHNPEMSVFNLFEKAVREMIMMGFAGLKLSTGSYYAKINILLKCISIDVFNLSNINPCIPASQYQIIIFILPINMRVSSQ